MKYNLEKYHPIELDDLIRLGREFDGGYVVSKRQIEKTDILLSFGVNDDWSFEMDFEKLKHIKIFSYDYSVSKKCKYTEIRDSIGCMLGYLFVLRRSKVKEAWRHIKKILHDINSLYKYFQEKYDRNFIPKYLGEFDDDKYISFDTIFNRLKNDKMIGGGGGMPVFVKMDIEGAEYKVLPCLSPYFDKINGIVVEFHGLKNPFEFGLNEPPPFGEISELLLKDFYVAHIHGCNNGGHIINSTLPAVVEITFINKNLFFENVKLSSNNYPLKGLDFPCDKRLSDIELHFNNPEHITEINSN
ncbi:MAG: hypothetical protein LBC27_08105 [Spirochaetaceae bacterium]|nr:hypothetical protein [Spirochaetaceae bacterium]